MKSREKRIKKELQSLTKTAYIIKNGFRVGDLFQVGSKARYESRAKATDKNLEYVDYPKDSLIMFTTLPINNPEDFFQSVCIWGFDITHQKHRYYFESDFRVALTHKWGKLVSRLPLKDEENFSDDD